MTEEEVIRKCLNEAEAELLRLAKLGAALLSQKDELEHLTKAHGFYCLQGLLTLIKEATND